MHSQRLREQSLLLKVVLSFFFGIGFANAFSSSGSLIFRRSFVTVKSVGIQAKGRSASKYGSTTDLSLFGRDDENAVSTETTTKNPVSNFFGSSPDRVVSNDKNIESNGYMGDLVQLLKKEPVDALVIEEPVEEENSLGGVVAVGGIVTAAVLALSSSGILADPAETISQIQNFFADPASSLDAVVSTVQEMGPLGYVYFAGVYTAAEILAVPAIPLTASAGYLFGVRNGTAVVLLSASIAAAVSFLIGRTFLREYVEKLLEDYPDFKKIDKAIGEEGFKLMLLLRLSPVFPFALSNYLYGVTSIKFWPYFFGTMIGFTPGTIAYVFTGEIGKSLTMDSASTEPWYFYVGALALLSGFIKFASDTATDIIEKVQDEAEN